MNQTKYVQLKQISSSLSPSDLVFTLEFNEALHMACSMLNNEEWDESLQEYATAFLEELRKKYPEKWNSSWRYDALLGYAYHIILNYEERYAAYKRAIDKIKPVPPQLLIAMARCCVAPGKPPITEEEAILLVKEAIKTTLYTEGVELLKGLYKSIGNTKEQNYWENILEGMNKNGPQLPSLDQIPNE